MSTRMALPFLLLILGAGSASALKVTNYDGKRVTGSGDFVCKAACFAGKVTGGSCRVMSGDAQLVGFGFPQYGAADSLNPYQSPTNTDSQRWWQCDFHASTESEVFCQAHCIKDGSP